MTIFSYNWIQSVIFRGTICKIGQILTITNELKSTEIFELIDIILIADKMPVAVCKKCENKEFSEQFQAIIVGTSTNDLSK